MFYRDAIRSFDALIGEIEAAGDKQKKTGWMKQAWHRRLTWLRWLRELRGYIEDKETMALARIVENEALKANQSWQPISTAPKDGTVILAYVPARGRAFACRWEPEFEYIYHENGDNTTPRGAWTDNAVVSFGMEEVAEYSPTHWMPLPSAPPSPQSEGTNAKG